WPAPAATRSTPRSGSGRRTAPSRRGRRCPSAGGAARPRLRTTRPAPRPAPDCARGRAPGPDPPSPRSGGRGRPRSGAVDADRHADARDGEVVEGEGEVADLDVTSAWCSLTAVATLPAVSSTVRRTSEKPFCKLVGSNRPRTPCVTEVEPLANRIPPSL